MPLWDWYNRGFGDTRWCNPAQTQVSNFRIADNSSGWNTQVWLPPNQQNPPRTDWWQDYHPLQYQLQYHQAITSWYDTYSTNARQFSWEDYNRQLQAQTAATYNTPQIQLGSTANFYVSNIEITPETPERQAERRRQAKLDDLAAERAKALLLEHLSEEQRSEYEQHQYFHVLSEGGRVYRIRHGSAGNVYSIGLDGNEEHKFCIHARDQVPHEDNMLAQMLLLRFDEEQFLATANMHW